MFGRRVKADKQSLAPLLDPLAGPKWIWTVAEGRLEGADLGLQLRHIMATSPPPQKQQMFTAQTAAFLLSPAPLLSFPGIYIYKRINFRPFFLSFFSLRPIKAEPSL